MITLLMMCFPIVEDIQGFIRLGDPVTVSREFTHGQVLTALKLTTPSDSYICSNGVLEYEQDKPVFKVFVPELGWSAGYGWTKKK